MSVWSRSALWILAHPRSILAVVAGLTIAFGAATLRLETDHTAGSFVSDEEEFVQEFREVGRIFGRSETILYVVFHDTDVFSPSFLQGLDSLSRSIEEMEGVENVLSLANVPHLVRSGGELISAPVYDADLPEDELRERLKRQPFLEGLLVSTDHDATVMMVRIDPVFNATPERIDLVERIAALSEELPGDAALAGFPFLRTSYAQRVTREAPVFTVLSLLVSLLFLFVTFRSWRAILLPTIIVSFTIVWTFGLMALFGQKLNIVTSVLPALLVIIGMATCIHLITKFLDQFQRLGNRRAAIIETVKTVGLATFLACLTTAVGFAVLVLSRNHLLIGFGIFAAAGIMMLYILAITLIPLAYVRLRPPSPRTMALATHDRFARFFDALSQFIRHHNAFFLAGAVVLIAIGTIGAFRISTDIFVFSDFYEDDPLRRDLAIFEEEFGGVLPMEVVIESDREGRFRTLGSMRQLERLQDLVSAFDPVGMSLSPVDLVKMGNQAYFGGHPRAYRLPSSYELPFLQNALGRFIGDAPDTTIMSQLPLLVDSTFTRARIFLGVRDIGTERMNALADTVAALARSTFQGDEYDVTVTGTAVMSTRSGESLVKNLVVSLAVALVIIAILMALLFRSRTLTMISLVPNVIPLLVVGGAMGFFQITLKPSTALIFSLAFGIAVDDSIHFLAKYRIHRDEGRPRDEAIRLTLQQTGKSILFSSLILVSGFLVFTLSGFGGTVTMGALTALTLFVALVSNLLLTPALLYRFGPEEHFRRSETVEGHVSTSPGLMA